MINSDTQIDEALLLRYFEGEVTLSEKDEIEKWIISSEANKKLAKQIYYLSFATKTMDTLKRTDARAALKEVRGRIRRERLFLPYLCCCLLYIYIIMPIDRMR